MTTAEYKIFKTVIEKFARALKRSNSWVEIEDVRHQAWECCLRAWPGWQPQAGRQLSTYLHQTLRWMWADMIRERIREQRLMQQYARQVRATESKSLRCGAAVPVDDLAARLHDLVAAKLASEPERQLLGLMVFPPARFRRWLRNRDRTMRPVLQEDYAAYLGLHYKRVNRYCAKIETLIREVLDA